mmetsp:Transcript_12253/g.27786  ORF Transcript_12253/g.27786 Transcript_12253/m.27786 type:complete len:290 (-) Transcript_12253:95-964(-)
MAVVACPALDDKDIVVQDKPLRRVRTLYLVRHGEAVHNCEEKVAAASAAVEALAAGHARGSPEYIARLEAARQSVLEQAALHDAALSSAGKHEALLAKAQIQRLHEVEGLPLPSSVFVSPLQRTLQTAAILFPGHQGIHVREQLRERRTGRPCDEHANPLQAARRNSFSHMSWNDLLQIGAEEEDDDSFEDKEKLRQRTRTIARVLESVDDDCLCVITHKAFLRELERGPLSRPEAAEFDNCEVRVYHFEVQPDSTISASLRFCRERSPSRSPRRREPVTRTRQGTSFA